MSTVSLRGLLVSAVVLAAAVSCFKKPSIDTSKLKCLRDEHCPESFVCRENKCVASGSPATDAAIDTKRADGPAAQDVASANLDGSPNDGPTDRRDAQGQDGPTADVSIAADAAEAGGAPEVAGTSDTGSNGGAIGSGGAPGTGGSGAGGVVATGGTVGSGGVVATGGTSATGGAVGSGGVVATGGTSATGGAVASGGVVATGGTSATGGAVASGGIVATGGTSATGGAVGSGGVVATGGASATGGALAKFSFFVTSSSAMATLANSSDGFGGDLRFGETGPGAGLRGADKICAAIAETSMPGSSSKQWRAFLSAVADAYGMQVNAIDRIGSGPWYDRNGKLVANSSSELLNMRPINADISIKNDFPNETGASNKDLAGKNLEVMTGSSAQGRLYSSSSSCSDWTSSSPSADPPRVGHSWRTTGCTSGGGDGPCNWMSAATAAGCGAGSGSGSVGASNGYGGIYCFALVP